MLDKDAGLETVIHAVNDLRSDMQSLSEQMERNAQTLFGKLDGMAEVLRSSREERMRELNDLKTKVEVLETRVASHSRLMWGLGGGVLVVVLETAIFLIGRHI